jgi:hypothetical protein
VDGNFSLEHMKMKKDADDVFLSDGEGYMVQWMPYKQHLDASIEGKHVCIILHYICTFCLTIHSNRLQHVPTTRLSLKPTPIERILMLLVLVHVHVLVMAASSLILLLTFKKENGMVTWPQCGFSLTMVLLQTHEY